MSASDRPHNQKLRRLNEDQVKESRATYYMTNTGLKPGTSIVIVLHTPREKCWGLLDEITAAGVFLRGLDLNAFDDWVHSVVHEESFIACCDIFFPMWRVERIARDEAAGAVPSLYQQVEQRTGRPVEELLNRNNGQ